MRGGAPRNAASKDVFPLLLVAVEVQRGRARSPGENAGAQGTRRGARRRPTRSSHGLLPRERALVAGLAPTPLALRLRLLLHHLKADAHLLDSTAATKTADRGGAGIVEGDRQADVGVGGAAAVRRIERDPAEIVDVSFRPRMAGETGAMAVLVFLAKQIAADVPGRHAEDARAGDEQVCVVLADARALRERPGGGRLDVGQP